ncbi:MAG: DNA topoisomerase IV subunit A [Planctomycetota bacterium]
MSPRKSSRSPQSGGRGRSRKPEGPKKAGSEKGGQDKIDKQVVDCIRDSAGTIHGTVLKKAKPELKFPMRSLSNVRYDEKTGYLKIGQGRKLRTLTVNTVKTFAQTLKMMSLSKEMVEQNTFATKREAYYVSKNWEDARFDSQEESDTVMDDIEALFSLSGLNREQLRFYPEEHGGSVAGELIVIDRNPATGRPIEIDCTQQGTGAWTIPHSVEHLGFRTKAKFVLAIETAGMFQRLQNHGYPQQAGCIIISMGGVPTRATRRFIRRLSDELDLPVYAFVDCDPYGISNIYRTLKVGSGNAAHINQFFCVPKTSFLGVTPQDIIDYDLPTHPLKDVDIKRAKDALKNDPFFETHKPWRKAIEQLVEMGVRAEQQAFAKAGLNYVIETYLPEKLKKPKTFLP